jgi:serine/threonine protein kinase
MTITNYTIKQSIGQGGMATVYLAEDIKFQTNVAIKVLNKEYVHNDNIRKRFIAEARNMYKMSHPNIIKVTDLIDDGDTVAFVMEYIEGETLKEYLDRKGKLSDAEIKNLFSQMLEAVGYVHEQNLVHRDIKPSNFMINQKGQVKLLDFGIAKTTNVTSSEYTQTGTGIQMGTPLYMSPEQVKSSKEVGASSDIYSLGVVLWQMVMGKKPYDSNTLSSPEIQVSILKEPLPITNTNLDSIIQKATAKEVLNRYENCLEMKKALSKVSEVEEKTILSNADEKTILKPIVIVEKDPKVRKRKTVVEVQEINNNTSKSQANITSRKIYSSKNILIVLGVLAIMILGVIILKNSHSNITEPFDIEIDTTAVADTAAAETTAVPEVPVETAVPAWFNTSKNRSITVNGKTIKVADASYPNKISFEKVQQVINSSSGWRLPTKAEIIAIYRKDYLTGKKEKFIYYYCMSNDLSDWAHYGVWFPRCEWVINNDYYFENNSMSNEYGSDWANDNAISHFVKD